MNNLEIVQNINFLFVFFAGIFSFLSPCILPIIPVYITYLAGNAKETLADGTIVYKRKETFLYTVCFTLGICVTFFLLGISFTALGTFLNNYQTIFTRIGGIAVIFMGLFQLGIFKFNFLNKERKIEFNIGNKKMGPLVAFIMGFTFSFSWTPCVGPTLSSVLLLASSSKNFIYGNILVFIYSLGFIIPFLILGLFTTKALNFFKEKQKIIKYTIKISGVLLILIGISMFTGYFNGISSYLSKLSNNSISQNNEITKETKKENEEITSEDELKQEDLEEEVQNEQKEIVLAPDFELKDQYGNKHKLSDYKGKVVFLNFWATWCGPCQIEMPHIEKIYEEYGYNKEDVIILGVASPKSEKNPYGQDIEKEEIIKHIENGGYTFPTIFDETGEVFSNYAIRAFPTTFMIDKNGEIYGYVPGSITKEIMINIIEQTRNAKKES